MSTRGYFGIGIEGLSKPMNAGSLFRSAHAFGASFTFTVAAAYPRGAAGKADTSDAPDHLPLFEFATVEELALPKGCSLVGIELLDEAAELPSFRHPKCAAYVLGPERGNLSPALVELCDFTVRIPTQFCVNVGIAGAIVMYDRVLSLGRFPARPVTPGGDVVPLPAPVFGDPVWVRKRKRRAPKPD